MKKSNEDYANDLLNYYSQTPMVKGKQLDLFQDFEKKIKEDLDYQPIINKAKLYEILNKEYTLLRQQITQSHTAPFLTRLEMYGRMKGLSYLLNNFFTTKI